MKMYKPQRLHPLAILEFIMRKGYSLVQALLPLFIIAIAQEQFRQWLLLALPLLLLLFLTYTILYWLRYVFYISGQELRVEYGVLVRKKRYIPFERIQTVQVSAGVLQRLLGLVKVQVETAGTGNKAEFVLDALTRAKAEELQQILQSGVKPVAETGGETAYSEHQLPTRSLLLLATTSNSIGVVISGMLVLISQLDDFFGQLDVWGKVGAYAQHLAAGRMSSIILAVLLLLLLAWLLSLGGTIIQFGGFKLRRETSHINISRGVFQKQQISIPLSRIQAVKVVESLLRQPLGMVSIQVVSISNTGTQSEGNVLFPLLPKSELAGFLEKVAPEFNMSGEVQRLPARSRRRYLLINIIPALIIALLCTIYLPWGFSGFILPLLGAVLGARQYADAGYQVTEDKILLRSRCLGRVTMIIPRRRIQSLHVSQNPFQVRSHLSNLGVAVASCNTASTFKLKGMDKQKCSDIMNFLSGKRGPWTAPHSR
jgi:putative membrane protein